jgi:hypothetical protein
VSRLAACALLLAGLCACSPALNWREVLLDRLTVFLPCKPDRAQRTVTLGTVDVALEMAGCEAGNTLYAVSHLQVKDANTLPTVVQQWQTVALRNLQSSSQQTVPWTVPKGASAAERLAAVGTRANGDVMAAQMAWVISGTDIYHVAVYAKRLSPEQSDTLFSDIKIQ